MENSKKPKSEKTIRREDVKLQNQKIYNWSKDWAHKNRMPFFALELVSAYNKANKSNIDSQKFGPTLRDLRKNRIIKINDFVTSPYKQQNCRMVREWISISYSNIQRDKRESRNTKIARESIIELDLFKTQK